MAESIRLTVDLLERLAAEWNRHGAPIAAKLAPGLPDAQMDAITEPLGLRVPPEARTWWGWHNGAHDASIVTSTGKAFSSLEHCVTLAARMRELALEVPRPYGLSAGEADEMARSVWNWDWLPLCEDGLGTMLVIDAAAAAPAGDISAVLYRALDDGSDAVVGAPSIGALVDQWTIALQAGTGHHSEHGDLWGLDVESVPPGFDERLL